MTENLFELMRNTQITTLVERFTCYVMLVKVDSRDTETVINALIKHI